MNNISRANGNSRRGALDHHGRSGLLLLDVLQAKHPGVHELKTKQGRPARLCLTFELKLYLKVGARQLVGVDVDLNVDPGGCPDCPRDLGALRFLNEKSLVYCARTWSCDAEPPCCWPPFVLMRSPNLLGTKVANT